MPPLGFVISFFNQDPNTIASQPDIFRVGSEPLLEEVHPNPSAQTAGGGLYWFTANLDAPIELEPDTRYFVSIVGLTPIPFATWNWAQGAGAGSTFYWIRGAHMYFQLSENRALELAGNELSVPCPADTNGDGSVTPADFTAWIAAFNAMAPECDQNGDGLCTPADFTAWIANYNTGC